jgi:hypothetical protein
MTNPTSNFGWQMPTPTDLVTDLPADFEVFGQAVDTSMADLKGGTTGQILSKATNTDMDFTWITNDVGDITAVNVTAPITGGGSSGAVTIGINAATTSVVGAVQLSDSTSTTSSVLASTPTATKSAYDLANTANTAAGTAQTTANAAVPKSTVTTAGDVIYATGSGVVTRLGIGTANQVLTVNTGATAPEWKTPAATTPTFAGCVLTQSNSTQSVATNTATNITFNTEAIDTDGYHSTVTNTDRITIPSTKVGKYLVTAGIAMEANTTGARVVKIQKNGSVVYETGFPASSAGNTSFGQLSFVIDLASGDYINTAMFHTAGVSLNVAGTNTAGTGATSLQATYLGA